MTGTGAFQDFDAQPVSGKGTIYVICPEPKGYLKAQFTDRYRETRLALSIHPVA
jgi:hypothetical protein